jgi:hypothetical protein
MRHFPRLLVLAVLLAAACHRRPPPGTHLTLFDGRSLAGWSGNPQIWSVKDGAIHGATDKGGQLILTDGDYSDFRLTLKSRLVSEKNHLGVCFWGSRQKEWKYGDCILVIPPTGGMWDYHKGKKGPPREKLPHPDFDVHQWHETEILAHLATGTVRMAVDGVEVTRYKDEDPHRLQRGPIGLQIHAGASVVEYKDVEIEVEPKEDRLLTARPWTPPDGGLKADTGRTPDASDAGH